ncbi:MAG: YHS domain-containing protein [Nitrospirota bacterium]
MAQFRDIEDMIEILNLAIARQEAEEEFFRRSAEASSNEVAKALFAEIAEDLSAYRRGLEARKEKLLHAKEDLGGRPAVSEAAGEGAGTARDPVCGMKVDAARAEHVSTYKGKTYSFCSADCKKAFDLAPEKYVKE